MQDHKGGGGCEYGQIKFEEMEKRIKDLSLGCDWGRTVLEMLEKKVSETNNDVKLLESRVWKLVVGLQVFTIVLNILMVVLK